MRRRLNRAAFGQCVSDIAAALGTNDEDEAFRLLQQVADRSERMAPPTAGSRVDAAAADLAAETKRAAQEKRADALRNALVRTSVIERANAAHRTDGLRGVARTLKSLLVWDARAPLQNSIESHWHALSRSWQSTLGNKLRQTGVEKAVATGQADAELAEELWALNAKNSRGVEPDAKASPGRFAAQAMKPVLDLARERLNAAGAHIGSAIDYVTHTTWDSRQLRAAAGPAASREQAFRAWLAKDGPRIADKTFDHLEPEAGETMEAARERFLRSVFNATSTGVHIQSPHLGGMADDGGGYIPPAYEGTRNIARGVSQQRVVYWKDAKSWLGHMRDFGGGHSIYAQVMHTLEQSARKVALMEKLGTNPQANFNSIVRQLLEQHRTDEGFEAFRNQVEGDGGYKTILSYLDGSANIPINREWAERLNQVFTWEATSKLGGVALTHLAAAPATVSSELAHHGVSHLNSLGRILGAVFEGRGGKELQDLKADVGAYSEGYNLLINGVVNPTRHASIPGYISWFATNFMRLTGLPTVLSRLQINGVKSVLMSRLGRVLDQGFEAIDPLQANILRRYGIGPEEWDLLRASSENLTIGGNRYLTPRAAMTADAGHIADLLEQRGELKPDAGDEVIDRAVQRFRWHLADQLLMYLNDSAEHATVTPGARERALLIRGARPGSVGWFIGRSIGQFKMWPLAAWNQILMREISYGLTKQQIGANIGWLFALSTAGGALRMSVNDAVNGRPQRNYMNPRTMVAALAQGGGVGIYGDLLFGETTRQGAGVVSTAMGPVASDIEAVSRMLFRFRDDIGSEHPEVRAKALNHLWPDLASFARYHVPFSNLIYLKGAVDYLLWYHMMEAASPGWWERTNKRLEREQGRSMLGYSPGAGVPLGVPGLYLKAPHSNKAHGVLAP